MPVIRVFGRGFSSFVAASSAATVTIARSVPDSASTSTSLRSAPAPRQASHASLPGIHPSIEKPGPVFGPASACSRVSVARARGAAAGAGVASPARAASAPRAAVRATGGRTA
jgi:hypothetical protein